MNTLLTFLRTSWERLNLGHVGAPDRLTCILLTPRFRASRHVVFLVLPEGRAEPVLVAKVARLAGTSASVEREVANLRAVQASRACGFDSIPKVVTFEDYCGRSILVETALVGRRMDPPTVRRALSRCCGAVTDWLVELQQAASRCSRSNPAWYDRLVERPLCDWEALFPLSGEERRMVEETRELVKPLRAAEMPLVVEHGDLSHPNVMLLKDGKPGVVDWELAEPQGLPACDLFFFLTYAAFARNDAHSSGDYVSAFHRAFFGRGAWARTFVRAYVERMRLPASMLTPLFVLCWARYTAGLLIRLSSVGRYRKRAEAETAEWLRANRYYAIWRHTLNHLNELIW